MSRDPSPRDDSAMTVSTPTPTRRGWLVPAALITLSLVPVGFSTARVAQLSGAGTAGADDAHYYATPVPIFVHVSAASIYLILGAFQFSASFRGRRPGWHRAAGRVLIPSGILAASAALWMVLFYPSTNDFGDRLESGFQFGFASAWITFLCLGFAAIRRGDVARHRAWMTRAYAIGIGAGTQVFTFLPLAMSVDQVSHLTEAMLLFAGWAINLAFAEWIIRRRSSVRRTMIPVEV
jgi:uncharacterized membrane protein